MVARCDMQDTRAMAAHVWKIASSRLLYTQMGDCGYTSGNMESLWVGRGKRSGAEP